MFNHYSRQGIQCEELKVGDIVYWCHQRGHEYDVHFGKIDEIFSDRVYVDYLEPKETRRIKSDYINNIPIDNFESETKFHKLPKRWNYDVPLFEIVYDNVDFEDFKLDIKNPNNIQDLYNKGYLVERCKNFHGEIKEEITKNGYRIVKGYPQDWGINRKRNYTTVVPYKLYHKFETAFAEVEANRAGFLRQASLSDYDWSVEQIDRTLNRWQYIYACLDSEVKQYRDWLLLRENVEDIEVRIFEGDIQWKYWKNKKWRNIETNM